MSNDLHEPAHTPLYHRLALGSLWALIALCLAWELWLAPLRPGFTFLAFKALPLLLPLRGLWRRDLYTMQWSSMVILLYFTEGVVRGVSDKLPLSAFLAWCEVVLVLIYFLACILYLRPYKKAAKARAKAAAAATAAPPSSTPGA